MKFQIGTNTILSLMPSHQLLIDIVINSAYYDLTTSSWSGVAFWSLCTFSAQLTVTAHFSMMIYVEVIMAIAIFMICLAFVKALVGCLVKNQELGEEMYAHKSTL